MELGLEETSGDESAVDLGRESDGSTGLELGDDAVAIGTSLHRASAAGLWEHRCRIGARVCLAVTLPVRTATPLRRKCPTASDANAAKVQDASKERERWGSTGACGCIKPRLSGESACKPKMNGQACGDAGVSRARHCAGFSDVALTAVSSPTSSSALRMTTPLWRTRACAKGKPQNVASSEQPWRCQGHRAGPGHG